MSNFTTKAIKAINVDAEYKVEYDDWQNIIWLNGTTPISNEDIAAKQVEIETEWNSTQYRRDRKEEYPPIGDQLDALFHAGVFPSDMAATLQAVKDKYPKVQIMARTTIRTEDVTDSEVTTAKMATDPTNASNLASGTVGSARMGTGTASSTTVLYGDGSWKAEPTTDVTGINDDIALLAFKTQANGSLARYNLVDQSVDAFEDDSGVDASASTNEFVSSSGKWVRGQTGVTRDTTGSNADTTTTIDLDTIFQYTTTGARTFTVDVATTVDFLLIGGGAGGGEAAGGGGGGAGGYRNSYNSESSGGGGSAETAMSAGAGTSYTVTVGTGGANAVSGVDSSIAGSDITTITSVGGGKGANYGAPTGGTGTAGGSGGGGGSPEYTSNPSAGGAGTASQGYAGGGGDGGGGQFGGGGGGAGAIGPSATTTYGGDGGDGVASTITGTSVTRAGGGAARPSGGQGGTGGAGGGGSYPSDVTGHTFTGSGGATSGGGGSGIAILRFPTQVVTIANLTLVSNTLTSVDAVTKGDLVMTYTNGAGTATLNTDLKGYISRDNGANYTELTLASQGTTGGHTIVTAHDVTLGGTDTSQMLWKVTTHNQSASKETRIHAMSLGWS